MDTSGVARGQCYVFSLTVSHVYFFAEGLSPSLKSDSLDELTAQ